MRLHQYTVSTSWLLFNSARIFIMPNTNPIVPLGWEEQVHRETYIAILKGQLRKPGAKKAFAAEIGISPQYLSYLLDPYDHRSPSQGMAQAIVRALSLTEHERSHMLEHLILAGGRASPAVHGQTYDDLPATMRGDDEVEGWGAHVQQLYEHAMITRDPEMARVHTTTSAANGAPLFAHGGSVAASAGLCRSRAGVA